MREARRPGDRAGRTPDHPEGACQKCSFSFKPWSSALTLGHILQFMRSPRKQYTNSNVFFPAKKTKTPTYTDTKPRAPKEKEFHVVASLRTLIARMTQKQVVLPLLLDQHLPQDSCLSCWKGARREMRKGHGIGKRAALGQGPHLCYSATVMVWCQLEEALFVPFSRLGKVPTHQTDRPRRGTHSGTSLGCSVLRARERHLHKGKWARAQRGTSVLPCPHSRAWAASPGQGLGPVVFAGDMCTQMEARDLSKNQDSQQSCKRGPAVQRHRGGGSLQKL